jgi:hypothetical protein
MADSRVIIANVNLSNAKGLTDAFNRLSDDQELTVVNLKAFYAQWKNQTNPQNWLFLILPDLWIYMTDYKKKSRK